MNSTSINFPKDFEYGCEFLLEHGSGEFVAWPGGVGGSGRSVIWNHDMLWYEIEMNRKQGVSEDATTT